VLKSSLLIQCRRILLLLLPTLLLLPALHLHPAHEHTHGMLETHKHAPVMHADFFPFSARDHDEHQDGHNAPDDTSSQPPPQIKFSTLLPRSLVLSPPVLSKIPISLPVALQIVVLSFLLRMRLLTRDHAPPVQDFVFSPAPPRSPPHFA